MDSAAAIAVVPYTEISTPSTECPLRRHWLQSPERLPKQHRLLPMLLLPTKTRRKDPIAKDTL